MRVRTGIGCLAACSFALWASIPLAGCGQTVTSSGGRTVVVALQEYRLNPQAIRAPAGQLTIVARNYGRLTHNLVIALDGRNRGSLRPLAPGQSGRMSLTLAPGSYSLSSAIQSDQALGMFGTLTVTR